MKLSAAIDLFVLDMRSQGRINSPNTEAAYRRVLNAHADDVNETGPGDTTRADVKATLRRWEHPNSQRQAHAILTSFYDWAIEEGLRDTLSPARQVRRAKARPVNVYRPNREEVVRLMDASNAMGMRERWVVHLGVLAGLRRQELCGLQRRHLTRPGAVWVTSDIGKGGRERLVPVLNELQPVVDEILVALEDDDDHVIPSRRNAKRDNSEQRALSKTPISGVGMHKIVKRVGLKAGLATDIGPHTLRHAFGDHVARYAGLRAAQNMLGHVNVQTTESSYTGKVQFEELVVTVMGFEYRRRDQPETRSAALSSHNVEGRKHAQQSQSNPEKREAGDE